MEPGLPYWLGKLKYINEGYSFTQLILCFSSESLKTDLALLPKTNHPMNVGHEICGSLLCSVVTHPIPPSWVWAGISWRRCWRLWPGAGRGGTLPEPSSWRWPAVTSVKWDPDPCKPSPPPSLSSATPRGYKAGSWGGGRAASLLGAYAHQWPSLAAFFWKRNNIQCMMISFIKPIQQNLYYIWPFWHLDHLAW